MGLSEAPYAALNNRMTLYASTLMLGTLGLLAIVLRVRGSQLVQHMHRIKETLDQFRGGDRAARVGDHGREDDVARLARRVDALLDALVAQEEAQRAAKRDVINEASRRRALFEHGHDGVVVLNLDGTVFEANRKCLSMLGYERDEFKAARLSDWQPSVTEEQLQDYLDGIDEHGEVVQTVHRRQDGHTFPVEVALARADWAGHSFVLATCRDISRRVALEQQLRAQQRELESLVAQRTKELDDRNRQLDAVFALSPDGVVSFDSGGRVNLVSPSFLLLMGVSRDRLLGLDEREFTAMVLRRCGDGARFPELAALRNARRRADAGSDGPISEWPIFEMTRPRHRVIEVALEEATDGDVSQVLYFRDVTHVTEVERMKSDFLTTAAHELRTPMTSIYGYASLMRTRHMDAERRGDMLDTIARQSEVMITMINELIDLSAIESRRGQDFEMERRSAHEVVAAALDRFNVPHGREVPVLPDCVRPTPIDADRAKLQQALHNVLSNAFKYSPRGGPVLLSWHFGESAGRRLIGLAVRDHGIGMTAEQLKRVGERFYRADTSGNIPGTGLGMTIAREILELHEGSLQVESTPGEGTTVTLWLPLAG